MIRAESLIHSKEMVGCRIVFIKKHDGDQKADKRVYKDENEAE